METTTQFRQLVTSDETVAMAGIQNPLVARIAEQAGFDAVYMTGAGTSVERLGWADVNLVTATEMTENAQNITDVIDIPVFADADNGYGNAINVMRTMRNYVRAGVAGAHMEDQRIPKRCGHLQGKLLVSKEEMEGKIKAAREAIDRQDPDFVLFARTDARNAVDGGLDEAIDRMNRYLEAGADAAFADALESREEVERMATEVNGPTLFHPSGVSPRLTVDTLEDIGVSMVCYPSASLMPTLVAVWDYLHDLAERDTVAQVEFEETYQDHPTMGLRAKFDITGLEELQEYEERFLPDQEVETRYEKSTGL